MYMYIYIYYIYTNKAPESWWIWLSLLPKDLSTENHLLHLVGPQVARVDGKEVFGSESWLQTWHPCWGVYRPLRYKDNLNISVTRYNDPPTTWNLEFIWNFGVRYPMAVYIQICNPYLAPDDARCHGMIFFLLSLGQWWEPNMEIGKEWLWWLFRGFDLHVKYECIMTLLLYDIVVG